MIESEIKTIKLKIIVKFVDNDGIEGCGFIDMIVPESATLYPGISIHYQDAFNECADRAAFQYSAKIEERNGEE